MPESQSSHFSGLATIAQGEWKEHVPGSAYRCEAHVVFREGKFVATAAAIPTIKAEAATEKDALNNLGIALAAAISTYKASGTAIPWSVTAGAAPEGTSTRWVIVRGVSWVEKAADVCGGHARIRSTRHTVWGLVEWRRLGLTDERILQHAPGLTADDLRIAWNYYEGHREEIDQAIRENEEA